MAPLPYVSHNTEPLLSVYLLRARILCHNNTLVYRQFYTCLTMCAAFLKYFALYFWQLHKLKVNPGTFVDTPLAIDAARQSWFTRFSFTMIWYPTAFYSELCNKIQLWVNGKTLCTTNQAQGLNALGDTILNQNELRRHLNLGAYQLL